MECSSGRLSNLKQLNRFSDSDSPKVIVRSSFPIPLGSVKNLKTCKTSDEMMMHRT